MKTFFCFNFFLNNKITRKIKLKKCFSTSVSDQFLTFKRNKTAKELSYKEQVMDETQMPKRTKKSTSSIRRLSDGTLGKNLSCVSKLKIQISKIF